MSYHETIIAVARELNLLTGSGELIPLDSLAMLELIETLEDKTGLSVPVGALRATNLDSIDAIARVLATVAPAGRRAAGG